MTKCYQHLVLKLALRGLCCFTVKSNWFAWLARQQYNSPLPSEAFVVLLLFSACFASFVICWLTEHWGRVRVGTPEVRVARSWNSLVLKSWGMNLLKLGSSRSWTGATSRLAGLAWLSSEWMPGILLALSPQQWGYKPASPFPAFLYGFWGHRLGPSCLDIKHFTNWSILPTQKLESYIFWIFLFIKLYFTANWHIIIMSIYGSMCDVYGWTSSNANQSRFHWPCCQLRNNDLRQRCLCRTRLSYLSALLKYPDAAQSEASGFGDVHCPGNLCRLLFEEPG